MNFEDRAFLYGCLLGDAGISFSGGSYSFNITHCEKQKEYLLYKSCIINRILGKQSEMKIINNSGYSGVRYSVSNVEILRPLYELFYPNGKKKIANEFILDNITLEALAIWWMDDGSCSKIYRNDKVRAYNGYLNTYETQSDNEIIKDILNFKYGFSLGSNYHKGWYRLRFNTENLRKLKKLISPYVIDSMKYKIEVHDKHEPSPSIINIDSGR